MIVGGIMGNWPATESSSAIFGEIQRLSDTSSDEISGVWLGGSAAR
jgi:hypothetical protein